LDWLDKVTQFIKMELKTHKQIVVLGDFNIAPDDRDVHDPEMWHEKILCSSQERGALNKLLALGFEDTFRLFDQDEKLFSWWDYRGGGFRRNHGLRIDLVLASKELIQTCKASTIDKTPRSWERPSDHVPVVAEFSR
jgi:exodeoxyribonuclease-3